VRSPLLFCTFALFSAHSAMSADIVNQPTLTLEGAKRVAAAAVAYAKAHDAPGASIAVVDAGGHTMYVERLDDTDIFYVLEGSATVVTGGQIVAAKTAERSICARAARCTGCS
jgi:hypothetical protein